MKLKPGISTTEFWLSLAAGLAAVLLAALEQVDAVWAVGAISVLGVVYNMVRGGLKARAIDADTPSQPDRPSDL